MFGLIYARTHAYKIFNNTKINQTNHTKNRQKQVKRKIFIKIKGKLYFAQMIFFFIYIILLEGLKKNTFGRYAKNMNFKKTY